MTSLPATAPRRRQRRIGKTSYGIYVLMALLVVAFLTPVVYLLVGSFDPATRVLDGLGGIAPNALTLENYQELFRTFNNSSVTGTIANFYETSGVVALVVVGGGLVVNSLVGYALARLKFRGQKFLLLMVVLLVIIPFEAIAVPLYFMLQGLRNSLIVQMIPFIGSAFSIYLFYTFFLALPVQLEEAARIDGAGPWRIFLQIIVPNAKPAFASVAILSFIASWSSYLWPLMMISQPNITPLPLQIGNLLQKQTPPDWGPLFAFGVLLVLPMAVFFVIFQRWFIQSVANFAVKG